jgi:hypothetical protein
MTDALISLHRAFLSFNKRAERSSEDILVATFVDCAPLYDILRAQHNQVIYGRRGTGKTHALKYLADQVKDETNISLYLDLRSVGSNGSLYNDTKRPLAERAAGLIVDVLNAVYNSLYEIALITLDRTIHPQQITLRLDDFGCELAKVKVSGSVEYEQSDSHSRSNVGRAEIGMSSNSNVNVEAKLGIEGSDSKVDVVRTKKSGIEIVTLNFANIANSLSGLIDILGLDRLWLLIDEWSEVPFELQPYLADLFRRTVLPISKITIKIAAIEHRSNFVLLRGHGEYVGLELGADVAADLNLDDFLVFDNDQKRSTDFFRNLIFKHYLSTEGAISAIDSAEKLIQIGFTQAPVFEEFVRAVVGVPRDALNLAAKIATKAYGQKIAMENVRAAARDWYQQDKAAVIRSNDALEQLLVHIIREVIGRRRARAFLLQSNNRSEIIEQLFDSRILHVLKRNVSSRDELGVRYDVYKIDYGCYVEMINTTQAPLGLFEPDSDGYVEVPKDDYRSIRRAILSLDALMAPPF